MIPQESAPIESLYSFLDFTLDSATERLTHGSAEIRLRPKSFQVLRYLLEHPERLVTREELMQAVWTNTAVTDESITKCIADVRKALGDDAQEIVRTVPKRGFLFQAEVRAEPRHARQPELIEAPPAESRVSRDIIIAAVFGVLAVAVIVAVGWRSQLFGRRSFEAIAVLPFESLSHGEDQQYLADGMTEALITNLGQSSPLRVIARTSVNQYLKTKKPVREIARELNVDVLVEGTIAQAGDRLRVTANLIQVSPEKHIWAHSYERNFRDVLSLQNEVANAIAAEIQGKLKPRRHSSTAQGRPVNPEAQIALWKARYFMHSRRNPESARKSVEYAEQAVRIEPDYALARAGLARAYYMLALFGGLPGELMPKCRAEAQKAIALDDEAAEAHSALANILLGYDWDWAGSERESRRAIELNPSSADAHKALSNYLAAVGRVNEAVAEARHARELDPFSFLNNRDVGRMLYFARKYDEAMTELRQAGDMQPNSYVVDLWIVKTCMIKGRADDAVAADLRVHASRDGLSPESLNALRAEYQRKGLQGYWTKLKELVLPKFTALPGDTYHLAEIDIYLGKNEEAIDLLEKAYQIRGGFMPWIKVDPTLDPLRSNPRFEALLRKMGLPISHPVN